MERENKDMAINDKERRGQRTLITVRVLNLLLELALILGIGGHMYAGDNFFDALFRTLTMFPINYTIVPPNIACNIARFAAALFSLSAVMAIVEGSVLIIGDRLKGIRKDSLFVYGDEETSNRLTENNSKVINGSHGFVEASTYVLMGSEEENLQFYDDHKDKLKNKPVYMKTEVLPGALLRGDLRTFCLEELAAQAFWKRYSMIDKAFDEEGNVSHLTVSIIGFGKLGEEILFYGLLENTFADVEFHLFADSSKFERLHFNLDEMNVRAYETDWYDNIDVLKKSDMIVVADQENQLQTINDLFLVSAKWNLYVFSSFTGRNNNVDILLRHKAGYVNPEHLIVFDWKTEAGQLETLYQQEELVSNHIDVLDEIIKQGWEESDTFKRYAYIYLLNLSEMKDALINRWGDRITEDMLVDTMHKRLCNYYWFNNWQYSPEPVPGHPEEEENFELRLSSNLCSPDMMSEEQRIREHVMVKTLLDLDSEE